ncbi:MAG: hypothetical protein ACRC9R_00435 [Enterovibrio sp.]
MQPTQPPTPDNPLSSNGISTQTTNTATQTLAIAGVQNTRQQPATAASEVAAAAGDPPLPVPQHRTSEIQANPSQLELAAQALVALQEPPLPQQPFAVVAQQLAPAAAENNTIESFFTQRIPGLQLAQEDPAQLAAVIHHRRAAAFNYSIAMRLSFSEQAIANCENNQAQQFLLQQINNEIQPYIRLKLLIMAFLRFYRSTDINLSRCAELFNVATGTISDWFSGVLDSMTRSTGQISQFIVETRNDLLTRGEVLLATETARAAPLLPAQTRPTPTARERSDSCWTSYGLIQRNSLASIFQPLNQALGLRWNGTDPDTASSAIESRVIAVHTLMLQLTFDLDSANLNVIAPEAQAIVRALLTAFNEHKNPSIRLRILFIIINYTRSILYYRVTGDLCGILNINSKTAASWTHNFKQHIANPRSNERDRNNSLEAAIRWLSELPNLINQHCINLIPRVHISAQTATATTTNDQASRSTEPVPHQLRQLLEENRQIAQGAPLVHRHAAQQVRRYQPYAYTRPLQQRAITPQQMPLSPTLRFSSQPELEETQQLEPEEEQHMQSARHHHHASHQQQRAITPQQMPLPPTLRFSPRTELEATQQLQPEEPHQPQQEVQQQQLQQLQQLQEMQLRLHQQLQRELHEEQRRQAQNNNKDNRQEGEQ